MQSVLAYGLPPSLMMRYHRPPCGYIPASSNQESSNRASMNRISVQLAMKKLPVQFNQLAMKIIPVQFKSPTLDSEVYKANILRYIADQKDQPRSKCLSVERELAAAWELKGGRKLSTATMPWRRSSSAATTLSPARPDFCCVAYHFGTWALLLCIFHKNHQIILTRLNLCIVAKLNRDSRWVRFVTSPFSRLRNFHQLSNRIQLYNVLQWPSSGSNSEAPTMNLLPALDFLTILYPTHVQK